MSRRGAALPLPGLRWRGLTVQLFLTVVLPLTGLLIAVAVGAAYLHQQAMRELVGERNQRAAVSLARALEEQLEHRAMGVRAVVALLEQGIAPAAALDASAYLDADLDAGVAVVDTQRAVLDARRPPNATWLDALPMLPARAWPRQGVAYASLPEAAGDETPMLVVAPWRAHGWVVGAFSPTALARDTLQDAFPAQAAARFWLVDASGRVIFAQPSTARPSASLTQAWRAAQQGQSGVLYLHNDDGEHVVAYSLVAPVGWVLIVEERWDQVASPWLHTTQLAPLLLVPVLLLALLALWFGARQVVEPLQRLQAQAAALAWGNYDALQQPVGGIEEIQRLQRTLRHMAQKVKRAHEGLHGYIGAITQGQEEERRRLARELHDETLQALIALQQRLQLLRRSLANNANAQRALAELQQLTEHTMRELRRMTHDLRPLYLEDLGLIPALETLAREIQAQHPPLQVEVLTQGPVRRLDPAHELALYRVAQEALRNIVRHAEATWAQVRLLFGPHQVRLEVQDNGRGFRVPESPAEFAPQGHYGLLGMYERAEIIGARLSLHAEPGQGTRVVLVLPLSAATPAKPSAPSHDAPTQQAQPS